MALENQVGFERETIVFWNIALKVELTQEDAREATSNIGSYFKILQDWQTNEKKNKVLKER